MKAILALLMILASVRAEAAQVRIVEGSTRSQIAAVPKDGQRPLVELREVQVSLSDTARSGSERLDILMLREPRSGLFWWRYQTSESGRPGGIIERFLRDSITHLTDDRVVYFMLSTSTLWVSESLERQPSMDAGQASVVAALERDWEAMQAHPAPWFLRVNLISVLDRDFFFLRGSASSFPGPKLRGVSRQNGGWRVVLDGPNGDLAAVLLSERFDLLGAAPVK